MNRTDFMRRAIEISRTRMEANQGGPFGAVIVRDGKIIAEGHNMVTSANDPTAHAEVVAIRNACETIENFSLDGCEIYTSCEPCPMCLAAIFWARIEKIYYANSRHDAADIGFDDAALYEEVTRPLHERAVPIEQMSDDEAGKVFRAWMEKEDRIEY